MSCMQNLQKELNIIKLNIEKSFIDPIPNKFLKDFVLLGSKFVRSMLTILYLKSQNIEITEDIYKILVAGELIHSASLLHDDVIDEADLRRGKPTLAKAFTPQISILAGDFLLSIAIEKILELNNLEILNIFKTCTKSMTEAEIKQYFLRNKEPILEDYLSICEGKTARLFSSILECSAILSNLSVEKAKKFGEIFGICFQIKNDLNFESAQIDKCNGIYTAKDIIGIEKTQNLLDNYKEEINDFIKDFSENIYKESLKDLIELL